MPFHTIAEQRLARYAKQEGDCIVWTRCCIPSGYGSITINYKRRSTHVVAWEIRYGPIPRGLQVDHLCRNRKCINTNHMELVTLKENVLRGVGITAVNARKTHCAHGHEFSFMNTSVDRHGYRHCRTCMNDWKRRNRRKV